MLLEAANFGDFYGVKSWHVANRKVLPIISFKTSFKNLN